MQLGELESTWLTSVGRAPLSLALSLSVSLTVGTIESARNMENSPISASCKENVGETKGTPMLVDSKGTPMQVDSATKKGYGEDKGAVVALPTAASKECDTKSSDYLSPPDVMQENKAPNANITLAGGLREKPLPFRERNMEEGKRLLPPYIKVPPKKLFGYPERYRSPTDAMVSPVSRGLLTRNRRPARTLAPMVPPKALENTFQEVVVDAAGGESGF